MQFSKNQLAAFFFILIATSLGAMQQEPIATPRYTFVRTVWQNIRSEGPISPKEMIVFIKQFLDGTIVVFDRGGHGELFDSNYNYLCDLWTSHLPSFVSAVYKIHDNDNNSELIIAQSDKALVSYNCQNNKRDTLYGEKLYLDVPYSFSLLQRPNCSLFIRPDGKIIERTIFPLWDNMADAPFEVDDFETPVEKIFIRNEGLVVPTDRYRAQRETFGLSDNNFDLSSVPDEVRKACDFRGLIPEHNAFGGYQKYTKYTEILCMPTIYCYHKTLDGTLLIGHDGFFTVWQKTIILD